MSTRTQSLLTATILVGLLASSFAIAEDARGSSTDIPDAVWLSMQGKSWKANLGCPARQQLSLLAIPFIDFAGNRSVGQLIVARTAASDVLHAFAKLYDDAFPIERMELIDAYDGDDARSMAANNTSAFNCRKVSGSAKLSEHAFGAAIDINPSQNPYVTGSVTSPPAGAAYDQPNERSSSVKGLITANGKVVAAFKEIGWKWGGDWSSLKDYQHFSKSGR